MQFKQIYSQNTAIQMNEQRVVLQPFITKYNEMNVSLGGIKICMEIEIKIIP